MAKKEGNWKTRTRKSKNKNHRDYIFIGVLSINYLIVKRGTKFEQREYWSSNGCIGENEEGNIEGKVCKKKE
jgi:hypothetical protein